MKLEVYIDNREWSAGADMYIVRIENDGRRFVAKPMELVWEAHNTGQHRIEPSLRFEMMDVNMGLLQALVDALACVGYRHESKEVGELKATKEHLEDMRKIAFQKIAEATITIREKP